MQSVHSCAQTFDDNIRLKKKVKQLKLQVKEAKTELRKKEEWLKIHDLLNHVPSTRSVFTQTTSDLLSSKRAEVSAKVNDRVFQRMQTTQLNLRKVHTVTLKQNEELQSKVDELKKIVSQCERSIVELKDENARLTDDKLHMMEVLRINSPSEVSELRSANKKLKAENQKLKTELGAIDADFFEEVEDMKFALKQAEKLNSVYEKCLRNLCQRYSLPFPSVK